MRSGSKINRRFPGLSLRCVALLKEPLGVAPHGRA